MSSPYVQDVTEQTFDDAVIAASSAIPVVVDFWAAWCPPCRALGPVLEGLAAEYDGKMLLAKIDADANPGLAQRYGVRGLPTVKIFRHGGIVDEFVGALPENEIRPLIERHLAGPADAVLAEARELAIGNPDAAIELLRRAVEFESDTGPLWLALARLYADSGAWDDADSALAALPPALRAGDEAKSIAAKIRLAGFDAGDGDDTDPHATRLRQAASHLREGRHDQGLELLGEILADDPHWRDGAAREAMLAAFALPDIDAGIVARWRRRIASLLN